MSTTYIALSCVAALSSTIVTIYIWPRRAAPVAKTLMVLMLASGMWALVSALIEFSDELAAKIFLTKFYFLGIVVVPPSMLVFSLQYSGRAQWVTKRFLMLLAVVPVATLASAWSNDIHQLFWTDMRMDLSGAVPTVEYIHGPLYWVWVAFAYVGLLVGTLYLLQFSLRAPRTFRKQVLVLLIGVAAPWLGNVLYVFHLTPWPHLDTTPMGFVITGLAISWGVCRIRIADIVPVARNSVFASMTDAVFVLGLSNHIVDLNSAAENILGQPAAGLIGQPAEKVFAACPQLMTFEHDRNTVRKKPA